MKMEIVNGDGFYMEGHACPPLDDFGLIFTTTSIAAADADADYRPAIDVVFSGFFDDLDDNGDLLIKASDHHQPVEKKTNILSKHGKGKGKEMKLLQTLKTTHGKGKEMRLLLASKDQTNPNEPAAPIFTNTIATDQHNIELEQVAKNVRVVTKQTKKRAAPEDDDEHKLEQTIKKVRHIYEKAAEAKRKRRAVLIDYVPPKQQPQPNGRFKSKKLQKLFAAR